MYLRLQKVGPNHFPFFVTNIDRVCNATPFITRLKPKNDLNLTNFYRTFRNIPFKRKTTKKKRYISFLNDKMSTNYHTISHILLDNRSTFFVPTHRNTFKTALGVFVAGTFLILFIFFVLFPHVLLYNFMMHHSLNYTIIKKILPYTSIIPSRVLRLHCTLEHTSKKK